MADKQTKQADTKEQPIIANRPVKTFRSRNFSIGVFHNSSKRFKGQYKVVFEISKIFGGGKYKLRFDEAEIPRIEILMHSLKEYVYMSRKESTSGGGK